MDRNVDRYLKYCLPFRKVDSIMFKYMSNNYIFIKYIYNLPRMSIN